MQHKENYIFYNQKNCYLFHSFYKETDFSRKSEVITFGYQNKSGIDGAFKQLII